MRLYISGKITDEPFYRQNFEEAEKDIKRLMPEVKKIVNPVKLGESLEKRLKKSGDMPTYSDYMQEDLKALFGCDAIYMLKNWKQSEGAKVELKVAQMTGKIIFFQGA